MSARKLGRLAGLVFVLVALVGGVAATTSADHETTAQAAVASQAIDIIWS